MIDSRDDGKFYQRPEFKICCAAEVISAIKPQIHGQAGGWTFFVSNQRDLILTSATTRSKRSIHNYPRWLALTPERTSVVQIQDINANGEGRLLLFAEWNGSELPTFRIFKRGSYEKKLLKRAAKIMAGLEKKRTARHPRPPRD